MHSYCLYRFDSLVIIASFTATEEELININVENKSQKGKLESNFYMPRRNFGQM